MADQVGLIELNAARAGTGYLKTSGGTLCGNEDAGHAAIADRVIAAL